jgi:hypothetical protein
MRKKRKEKKMVHGMLSVVLRVPRERLYEFCIASAKPPTVNDGADLYCGDTEGGT